MAFGIKSLHEIHRRDPHLTPHSWHFCSAIFNPAKWSSVWNDRLNPPLVFWLQTIESRAQPIAQRRRTELVQRWQSAFWHVVSCLFHISRLVNHFYANSSPSRWCAILLFQYLIENLSRHFFRLFTLRCLPRVLHCSRSPYLFFWAVDCSLHLIFENSRISFILSSFSCLLHLLFFSSLQ